MDIQCCGDCGNSPKNALAKNFVIALFGAQTETAKHWLAADAVVEIYGSMRLCGREEILAHLKTAERLEIKTVVTHGRAGAVAGVVTRERRPVPFAVTLRFATAAARTFAAVHFYTPDPDHLLAC